MHASNSNLGVPYVAWYIIHPWLWVHAPGALRSPPPRNLTCPHLGGGMGIPYPSLAPTYKYSILMFIM